MDLKQPFAPRAEDGRRSHQAEIEANGDKWARIAQQSLPPDVGFVMVLFLKGSEAGQSDYLIANVPSGIVRRRLKKLASDLPQSSNLEII